jgi:diguanylate cyclase (GGDEF)-like protein
VKILIADDDAVARLLVTRVCQALGHDCLTAADGTAAWDLYLEQAPDVVISDRLMPGMDGVKLCRRIRSGGAPTTYVVLVTGLDSRADASAGMEAGADDYLTKPIDPFQLQLRLVAAQRTTALHQQLASSTAQLQRMNVELTRLSRTDALTGVGNRMRLHEDAARMHAHAERHLRPYAVALCDVDHFKAYNDRYGHLAGDEALRRVAETLATSSRREDAVYRYGGEEFVLLSDDQRLSGAVAAAERCRQAVESLALLHAAAPTMGIVTISVGIAEFRLADHADSDAVLLEADDALYRAKRQGRNRVVVASGTVPAA